VCRLDDGSVVGARHNGPVSSTYAVHPDGGDDIAGAVDLSHSTDVNSLQWTVTPFTMQIRLRGDSAHGVPKCFGRQKGSIESES
jgi:hypothetical protein